MNNNETLPPSDFKDTFETGEYILIDVRTPQEQVQYGVVSQNQTHIDITLPTAAGRIEKLPKEGKYLIYCWHGVRSKNVLNYMKSQGFTSVQDLQGGIDKWNFKV